MRFKSEIVAYSKFNDEWYNKFLFVMCSFFIIMFVETLGPLKIET